MSLVLIPTSSDVALLSYPVALADFFYSPLFNGYRCYELIIGREKFASTYTDYIDAIRYIGSAIAIYAADLMADVYGWSTVMLILADVYVIGVLSAFLLFIALRQEQKVSEMA